MSATEDITAMVHSYSNLKLANEYREDPGDEVAVRDKMARYGGEKVCEVRVEVKWGNNSSFEPGAVELCNETWGGYLFFVRKTNGALATRFDIMPGSSITATHDSLTFTEVDELVWNPLPPFTVHLRGADQKQLQLFLDKLPDDIKEKYLREPTGANQKTKTTRRQEQKVALHEEPTREAQQLTSRQEQLQQKELGEAGLREQLREKENEKQNLERLSRETEQQLRGEDEQQQNLQRQLREKDEQQQNLQRQLREKDEQQQNLQRQLRDMEQHLREKDEQQQNLQIQLREMEKQLRNNKKQEKKLQEQLMEKEQQLTTLRGDKERESTHFQETLSDKLKELADLQRELRDREQDIVVLRKDLSAAKKTVSKFESQLRTRDWVLSQDEIQSTSKCLREGGWGRVVEGRYCGSPVAIKKLHRTSLSPQERSLFEREMDIASRCRHPCLLQFIGATVDKSPQFVTELMETSLRALLGKQQLSEIEVSVISLDVARALNYLHQRKPKPIVHRDVSSANVLLWKQNNQWRGKVSDYGTAKFLEEIMTCAVGALIYGAPEAGSRHNQTVKMDVYSFGVLVCEMFIRDLPDPDGRDEQVARVANREFRGLIMWCIEEDPEMRPSMEEIIEKLEPAV